MTIVSSEKARRIAVRAQLLDGSATNVLDTVRQLGYLQIDPISTVAPPQQLVLWSRLGLYDAAELDRLLWKEKKLIIAGPLGDDGEIRGIFVFQAGSLEELDLDRPLVGDDCRVLAAGALGPGGHFRIAG